MLVNACAPSLRQGPDAQERSWPAYLGSSRRAGAWNEAPEGDAQPVWRNRIARGINGAPALGEEVIAVSQTDKQVALLARATGEVIWRHRLDNGLGAGPLITDDRVLVAEQGNDARVYALRLSSGKEIWAREAGDTQAPLALDGDAVYAAATTGAVSRLRVDNGAVVWRSRVPGGVRAAPVPVGRLVAIAALSDSLFLLDAATGAIRARRSTRGTVLAAPAWAESLLVVGTATGYIEAFDPVTLEPRWSINVHDPVAGSIAAANGMFWAVTVRGTMVTIAGRGSPEPRLREVGMVIRAGPAPVAAGVYLAAVNGELTLVDSAGGRVWSARVNGRVAEPPLVDARTLIVVTRNGEVVMFR